MLWLVFYLEQCQSNPNEKHACKWDTPEDQQVSNEATQLCEHLLKDEKFEKCRKVKQRSESFPIRVPLNPGVTFYY